MKQRSPARSRPALVFIPSVAPTWASFTGGGPGHRLCYVTAYQPTPKAHYGSGTKQVLHGAWSEGLIQVWDHPVGAPGPSGAPPSCP